MKKPRKMAIHVEIREDVRISWNEKTNSIELLNSAGQVSTKHLVSLSSGYEREGKSPKIVRQLVNESGGTIKLGPETPYFDRYLAIDTSYKAWNNYFICTTAGIAVQQTIDHTKDLEKGDGLDIHAFPRLSFLCKPGNNPERYGWMKVINALVTSEDFKRDFKYAIIVDSELGILPKINAREEPIIGDYFLPANISLIYASADTGQEYFWNQLIKWADRAAANSLKAAIQKLSGEKIEDFASEFWDLSLSNNMDDFAFLTLAK